MATTRLNTLEIDWMEKRSCASPAAKCCPSTVLIAMPSLSPLTLASAGI
jgi:hypothetical protein